MLDEHMRIMHIEGMTLNEYLESKPKLTDAAFGELCGLSQSQISRLRNGKTKPSHGAIEAIHTATNGKVKPKDWFEVSASREAAQ